MEREETLVEIVGRLEKATGRLETLIDGNVTLGYPGLAAEVRRLRAELDEMRNRQVSLWQWVTGYILFVISFGLIAIDELQAALELTRTAAFVGGGFMLILSCGFFLSGLGWIRWR
ncbi:hypothetical protein [Caldilinea sp.]|uniref:hypothetical protein n=1 Tax=Caldilinea sp. TaxID=2293560 RepID=UPI002CC62D52|nr:hypothetical protein [Anaerolineales bacterium]HQY92759.1 hypothetical protein [Caldilinea sp.]